jgi:anti-anti-sigma factor
MKVVPDLPMSSRDPWLQVNRSRDDEPVLTLAGELDLAGAGDVVGLTEEVLRERPLRLRMDLRELTFIDASGLRALVTAAEMAAAEGVELVLDEPPPMLLRLAELCGCLPQLGLAR